MRSAAPLAFLIALSFILPVPFMPAAGPPARQKEWTILVYEDADNNLESAGVHDVNEMETVGSTDEMNIIVQFDRCAGFDTTNGNWEGAKRYYITKDSDPNLISSKELADLGEVNMGDPETFINFTTWAVDHYPAKRYLVVFWDHGGGWHGACWDDTDADYLDLDNVSTALNGLNEHLGRPVDVVGMDACLMAGIEIIYQLRGSCKVAVLSGTTEPDDGWPYDWILPALAMKPYMSNAELATEITNDYVNSYTDGQPDPQDTVTSTMSAWNMSLVDGLFEQFDQLSMRLAMKARTYNEYLRYVRDVTESYDPQHAVFLDISNYPLYDIYDFCQNFLKPLGGPVLGFVIDQAIKQNMVTIQDQILGARIAERHGPRYADGWGMTVYFPSGENSPSPVTPRTQYDARYENIDFSRDMYWDDFLKAFVGLENVADTPPYVTIGSPTEGAVLDAKEGNVIVSGTAFDTGSVSMVEVRIDNGSWKKAQGNTKWEFGWSIASMGGKHTLTARSSDGFSTSPEISRTFVIKPAPAGPGQTGYAMAWVFAVVIVAAIGVVIFSRMKGIPLRKLIWRRHGGN
jgi:clostripain